MPLIQPALNATPFAKNGLRNAIPTNPDPDAEAAASMELGFPELTMKKITLGGIPPSGRDMNGILNFLSQHQVWLNGGGQYKFNADLANAVGGYAKGAVIASNDGMRLYVCKVDGNLNDPNSDLTGWALFSTDQLENILNSLQDQITIEKADRIYSDNLLNDKIDLEITTRQDQIASVQQSISDEAATRSNADANLQQAIDNESNTRSNADYNLQQNIYGEENARISADNNLQSQINGKLGLSGGTVTGNLTVNNVLTAASMYLGNYSAAQNGWTALPNGLIFQWGRSDDDGNMKYFPIPFPNNAFSLVAQQITGEGTSKVYVEIVSNSEFKIYEGSSSTPNTSFYWMAIGN
ncbi:MULTISPECIES: hypothetical protein [Acinetobacter]|uniref:gp53-like domain-containing protein n=1 Tax=Acinetobacter TaxID=469 RepID=UPI001F4B0F1E|nr:MULTISPECIES: hypothetical protein [Acinetobacter]MCH7381596.1 hypothetical protein [Acinetobacter higginsii]